MNNLKPCLGTCSWEPCWQPIAWNLPIEFVLGTRTCSWEPVLRTLACEPVLAKLACKPVLGEPCFGTCSWKPCLGTCSQGPCRYPARKPVLGTLAWELEALFLEPLLVNLFLRTLLGNLFLRTLLGNLVLRTLLGNLFPGTLPGNPLLANLFLETFFATFSWKPVPGNLAWEPVPGLGTLLGNFWNPCLGTLPGNLFLGTWLGNRSWFLGWLRTPSKVNFLGTDCKYGYQVTVPKQGQEPFPSKVPSTNKARRKRFSSKRPQEELVPKQNFQEQLGTLACEPLLGNLASEPLPSNLA